MPVAAETAARALTLLEVSAGHTLVINGAAGGVGTAAVQFARDRNATVIGTASPANHDFLRSLGAMPTTYGAGVVDRVRALAPAGVDLAFDVAGQGALPELIELTGSPVRVLTIADPQAGQYGCAVHQWRRAAVLPGARRGGAAVHAGSVHVSRARTFPLADAPQAHRISEQGHVRGKLVLLLD